MAFGEMVQLRRIAMAAAVVCLFGGTAAAEGPLASVQGLPEGPAFATARAIADEVVATPDTPYAARRNAERAAERIRLALRAEGYYAARATPETAPGEPPRAQVLVSVGDRFVFGDIVLEFDRDIAAERRAAAEAATELAPGAPARSRDVVAAETRILAALLASGLADAQIGARTLRVDHDRGVMDVWLRFQPGEPVFLGAPVLAGEARVDAALLTRLASYEAGQAYDPEALRAFASRLRATSAFSSVAVGLEEGAEGPVRPVQVTLNDAPRRTLSFGAAFSTTEGGGAEARWRLRNAFGGAEVLSVEARAATIERGVSTSLGIPAWRRPGRELTLSAALEQEDTDAFERVAVGVEAEAEQPVRFALTGALGVGVRVQDTSTAAGDQRLVVLRSAASLSLDRADDALDPTRGVRARFTLQPIAGLGDDAVSYLISDVEAAAYRPLRENRLVAAARVRAAAIASSALDATPADDLFFAGGGGSVRGYPYQSISPRDVDGALIGGASLFEAAFELRARFAGRLGGVAFLDGGAASASDTPDFGDMRWGAGVGVRYFTDFGPLRADIAAPLNPFDGDPPVQLYLSIGQSF